MTVEPALVTKPSEMTLSERYSVVRSFTERLCQPLCVEDCVIQSMPDASPVRWHLAHTTWFFETFLLSKRPGYKLFDAHYAYLFNSYYNTLGKQFPRPQRGLLSRPRVEEVFAYRRYVDEQISEVLNSRQPLSEEERQVLELGLHHEQQHQELIVTDVKHLLSLNPLFPVYLDGRADEVAGRKQSWYRLPESMVTIGYTGAGFAYDNESPQHRVYVPPFELSSLLVTCGEYLDFVEDGGYREPEWWLSLGWQHVTEEGWQAPLYWIKQYGKWYEFTLGGLRELNHSQPVCHVSYFEADAFARRQGARLPTESEWEYAAQHVPLEGNFVDGLLNHGRILQPAASGNDHANDLQQMFGDVWQWTSSSYSPYPGYRPPSGALGEYNGKFMCNQYVLRGGSCATHSTHIRRTYRNFFQPEARWQFSGIRLARDV